MPSLPPSSTYYHYYPFGTTDISTNIEIFSKISSIVLQSCIIIGIWMIGNYALNKLYVHDSNIYDTYYLYVIGELYWVLIPHTIFLYVILTIIFDALSVHKHCKYYMIITCIWTLSITFILISIININTRDTNSNICNISISWCSFSIYQFMKHSLSFFISITSSTFILYIIEIQSKSLISIILQCILCFKYTYCKLICSKQYRLKRNSTADNRSTLLSSELMSELNVKDEEDLRNKFLLESIRQTNDYKDSPCCCNCNCDHCCLCYLTLYSSHKFLFLLVLINISFFICFTLSISMDRIGTDAIAQKHYITVLIIWFFICFILKTWMKQIGRHLDIVRLDIKLTYCSDITTKKQIYHLTKTMSYIPQQMMKEKSVASYTNNAQMDYDEFRFDISFEIAMEIFIQIMYYSFYRDFTLVFYSPKWNEFLIFGAIHLFIIIIFYCIRILPFYYNYTLNVSVFRYVENEVFSKYTQQSSITLSKHNYNYVFTVISPEPSTHLRADSNATCVSDHELTPKPVLTPMMSMTPMDSIDEEKTVNCNSDMRRQVSAYEDDNDTIHINALDNVYQYYQKGLLDNNFKTISPLEKNSKTTLETGTMPRRNANDTYYDWRNRISIDCAIRCIVMIITAFVSYCNVIVYYMTGKETKLSFTISTYYFLISVLSELIVYGILYAVLSRHGFNVFQPFARLYAKSTHTRHYVLLFVVCCLFLY